MSAKRIAVEILYPEFGNQGGDNGNPMYLRACLPDAEFIETAFTEEPVFATRDVSMVYLGYMTERQQRMAAERLMPYAARLAELAERGCVVLFTGNAAELLGESVTTDAGETYPCLGLFDFTTTQDFSHREPRVYLGAFKPVSEGDVIEVAGYHIGFSSVRAGGADEPFCTDIVGRGLDERRAGEGFRRGNLIATWLSGPLLPLNPLLTAWLLRQLGSDGPVAFEAETMAAYRKRVEEFKTPGIRMPI